jgi:hypothetical protein
MTRSANDHPCLNDRAMDAVNSFLQIVADADAAPRLETDELKFRFWRLLLEEFDDLAREITADSEAVGDD